MFGIGWTEVLVILVVALLVLGPDRLPSIARGLGQGLRDLRRALSGLDDDEPPPRSASWNAEPPPSREVTPSHPPADRIPPSASDSEPPPEPSDHADAQGAERGRE